MANSIQLTPTEIKQVSSKISKQATQIDSAVSAANSSVNTIRQMKSDRLEDDIQQWDKLKKQIDKAVQTLNATAKELKALAIANENANKKR